MRLKSIVLGLVCLAVPGTCGLFAQINTDRMMTVGCNALYFEDYVLSIQYFNQVINAKPYLNEPYFYRGVAKLSLEDYVGAENDCSRAISINPYVVDCYQVRGLARIMQGKYADAISDYRTALRRNPENRPMRHNLILCYLREENPDQAWLEIDTLLRIAPKYTPAMSMRSHLLVERQDTAAALAVLDSALVIERFDASLYRDRAMLKAMTGDYPDAEEDLNMSLRYSPEDAAYYIDRALVRFYRNNLTGAMADYDIALEIEPGNVLGRYNRGILRAQIGDDNRAIEDFDVVLDAEPDNMMAVFNRGLLRDKTGDLTGAVQDYTTVLAEYPNFIYGYELRAAARYLLGDKAGSEQDELVVMRDRMAHFGNSGPQQSGADDAENGDKDDNSQRTRKESDRNVWNYKKIVVSENESERFSSEYRGKVQNRNVDVHPLSSYQFSWFADAHNDVDREVRFSMEVETINSVGGLPYRLLLTNKDLPLTESQIKSLFDDVDRQTLLIEEEPDNPYHYFARALDFCLLQDFTNAENDFTRSILAGSGLWAAYFGRSIVRSRSEEMSKAEHTSDVRTGAGDMAGNSSSTHYQLIHNDLTKTIDMAPEFAYAYYNRGNLESSVGDYRTAVADYTSAISLNGRFAEAYYNRGLALVLMDRIEEGLDDFRKAGELGIYSSYNVMKRFSPSDK